MSLANRLSKMESRLTMLEAANGALSQQLHDVLEMLSNEPEEEAKPISFMAEVGQERDETQSLG